MSEMPEHGTVADVLAPADFRSRVETRQSAPNHSDRSMPRNGWKKFPEDRPSGLRADNIKRRAGSNYDATYKALADLAERPFGDTGDLAKREMACGLAPGQKSALSALNDLASGIRLNGERFDPAASGERLRTFVDACESGAKGLALSRHDLGVLRGADQVLEHCRVALGFARSQRPDTLEHYQWNALRQAVGKMASQLAADDMRIGMRYR